MNLLSRPRFTAPTLNAEAPAFRSVRPGARRAHYIARNGVVAVPVYRTRWKDKKRHRIYTSHVIIYRDTAGEHREKHAVEKVARDRADQIAGDIANGQISMLSFTPADKAAYQRARELAGSRPLELLAADAAEGYRLLDGRPVSIADACRDYIARHPVGIEELRIPAIVEELLSKRTVCSHHRRNLAMQLGRFAEKFDCPFTAVQSRALDDWLDSLTHRRGSKVGLRTRRNHLNAVINLVNFAKARNYLAKDWSVTAEVSNPDPPQVAVNLYTPEELAQLLNKAETYKAGRKLVPLIAITAFAGVRHGEMNEEKIGHLDWSDIDWEAKRIYIDAGAAKQTGRSAGDDRAVDMPDNLVAWLAPYRRPAGKLCPLVNTSSALCRLRRSAGIKGPKKNALRKSFITYQLALGGYIEAVAAQAGNSPAVIRKNYRAARHTRLKDAASRWFAIMPARADVLPLFAWAKAS